MNTTAAAEIAGVSVSTIRRWCRNGKITATKVGTRWTIDPTTLPKKDNMTEKYTITEIPNPTFPNGSPRYKVVRADGTTEDRLRWGTDYPQRTVAEFHRDLLNAGLPDGFHVAHRQYPARSMGGTGWYWLITARIDGDPREFRTTWDDGQQPHPDSGCATPQEVIVRQAASHLDGAAERIAKAAEAAAVEAAEAAVRDARRQQLDTIRQTKGSLATPKQVAYIESLLRTREITGEGGGFFIGPTDRAGIEELSKEEASLYIDSLRGNY